MMKAQLKRLISHIMLIQAFSSVLLSFSLFSVALILFVIFITFGEKFKRQTYLLFTSERYGQG